MLVQEKLPGGKLLCVDVEFTEGHIRKIRITGDFFLHPEETIERIEESLVGMKADGRLDVMILSALAKNRARLIGAAPEDIERLIKKAAKVFP
jgi:lipoate-protein ligase A